MLEKDKRFYVRKKQSHSMARISSDQKNWLKASIYDLSASGLKFYSEDAFTVGDVYWFDLSIQNHLTESTIHVQGRICRKEHETCGKISYAAAFEGLSAESIIQIDEILLFNNRILTENEHYIE